MADAQGNSIYAHNTTREILVSILGKKRSRKSNTALSNEVVIKMKKDAGISLTIDESRLLEADSIVKILKQHEKDMINIKDYLA